MNTLAAILPQRALSELCFCGNPTIPEHDKVFCSRKCSLDDAALSLMSHSTHYRNGAEWHDALSPTALALQFAPHGSGVPSRTRTSSLAPIYPRDTILSSGSYSLTSTIALSPQSPEMRAHNGQGLFPQPASLKTEAQLYAEACRSLRASTEMEGHLDTASSSRTVVEVEEQTVADIFASMQEISREEFEWMMKFAPVPPRCRRIADSGNPSDDDGLASIWTHPMCGLRRTKQSVSRIRNIRKSVSTLFAKRDGSSKPIPSVDSMRVWSPREESPSVEHQEPEVVNDRIPVKYAVRRSVSFASWHHLEENTGN